MAEQTPICNFGWKAPSFSLPGVDGKTHSLVDLRGKNGTLVVFICNHCPYVKAVIDRIVRDANELKACGINTVAISSNDAEHYPEDSFDNMKRFAKAHGFTFPYLYDESQEVARRYDAVCTPDFFGFNGKLELQYRGRLDASRREAGPADARRELFEAMKQVAETARARASKPHPWAARSSGRPPDPDEFLPCKGEGGACSAPGGVNGSVSNKPPPRPSLLYGEGEPNVVNPRLSLTVSRFFTRRSLDFASNARGVRHDGHALRHSDHARDSLALRHGQCRR